ncbi:MAG: hypothetical protein JNK15_15075 [Planctomycetes bacterium]|nr:hypothetical protein [Planctomycetota bacterium]
MLSILVAMLTVAVPVLARVERPGAAEATMAPAPRLLLQQAADGTWVDAAGQPYEVRRIDRGHANG